MIANVLAGLVALIHLYIVYLEMVLWDTPRGRKAFKLTPEFASAFRSSAAPPATGSSTGGSPARTGSSGSTTSFRPSPRSLPFQILAIPSADRS